MHRKAGEGEPLDCRTVERLGLVRCRKQRLRAQDQAPRPVVVIGLQLLCQLSESIPSGRRAAAANTGFDDLAERPRTMAYVRPETCSFGEPARHLVLTLAVVDDSLRAGGHHNRRRVRRRYMTDI